MKSQRDIFAENLTKWMKAKDVDQQTLAQQVGVSNMSASKWARGEAYPRIDKIQAIADYLNIRKSDLTEESKPTNLYEVKDEFVQVPILGQIACGDPIYVAENFAGYRWEAKGSLPSGNTYYLEAKGDSMQPTIPHGAWVLVREQPDVESGEIAAVQVNGNTEATLKRIRKQGDTIMLVPDNPTHETRVITEDYPARIVGKAIRYNFDL